MAQKLLNVDVNLYPSHCVIDEHHTCFYEQNTEYATTSRVFRISHEDIKRICREIQEIENPSPIPATQKY